MSDSTFLYSERNIKSHSYFNWYVLVFPLQSKCERYIFQKMCHKMAQSRHCIHARLLWKLMTKKPAMKNALKKRNTIKRQYNTMHFISRLQNLYPRDFWVAWYSQSTTTKHFVRIHRIHIGYFYWQFWSYKNKSAFAMHTISVTHVLSLTHNLGSRNIVHHSAECTNWVVRFLPKGLSKKGCQPNSGK